MLERSNPAQEPGEGHMEKACLSVTSLLNVSEEHPTIYRPLPERFRHSNVVFVAGAGLSYDSGYPLVREFLSARYIDWLCAQCEAIPAGIPGLLAPSELRGYLPEVASVLRRKNENIEFLLDSSGQALEPDALDYVLRIIACAADAGCASEIGCADDVAYLAILLLEMNRAGHATVITFNYDYTIENAISWWTEYARRAYKCEVGGGFSYGPAVVYDINDNPEAINLGGSRIPVQYPNGSVPILKAHGSVNLLRCYDCGSAHYSCGQSLFPSATALKIECSCCGARDLRVLIVPPGMSKEMPDTLSVTWDAMAEALDQATAVVFLGYSMPEYDAASRELFAEGLTDKEIIVVDPSPLPETLEFVDSLGVRKRTVVRTTATAFLEREMVRYDPVAIGLVRGGITARDYNGEVPSVTR